jgi:hypothetical protein
MYYQQLRLFVILGCAFGALSCTKSSNGSASSAGAPGGGSGGSGALSAPWDWVGILGTGQSLAVGQFGMPAQALTQPYNNLKLSTGSLPWPVDPNDPSLALVPLVEPIGRLATGYPSQWPTNIAGETPHAAMANQITALVQAAGGRDYLTVHGEFGENGQSMAFLKKGAMPTADNPHGGRAFEATTIEVKAVQRLAQAAGKTYGIGAITLTHGESDAGNTSYDDDLVQLWSDYNADLRAITGQTQSIPMLVSQQNSINDNSPSTLAEWRVGVDHPGDFVCTGPKYHYPYYTDGVHLITDGYEALGEKYAQVYFERVVLGHDWQPLQPTTVERDGAVIRVHFHVPGPPLTWDDTFQTPHDSSPAWQAGNGFEVTAGGKPVTISSVAIVDDAVQITCADLPASGVHVSYALVANATAMSTPFAGTKRWGKLRDSDPFVGATTMKAQPNYAVAFTLPVP